MILVIENAISQGMPRGEIPSFASHVALLLLLLLASYHSFSIPREHRLVPSFAFWLFSQLSWPFCRIFSLFPA